MAVYTIDTYDDVSAGPDVLTTKYIRVRAASAASMRGLGFRAQSAHTLYQPGDVTDNTLRTGGPIVTGGYQTERRVCDIDVVQYPPNYYFDFGLSAYGGGSSYNFSPRATLVVGPTSGSVGHVDGTRIAWDIEDLIYLSTYPSPELTGSALSRLREGIYGADSDRMALVITDLTTYGVFAIAPMAPTAHAGDLVPWYRSSYVNPAGSYAGGCSGPAGIRCRTIANPISGVPQMAYIFNGTIDAPDATDPQIGAYNRSPNSFWGTWFGPPPEVEYWAEGFKTVPTVDPVPDVYAEVKLTVNEFALPGGYSQTITTVSSTVIPVIGSSVSGANTTYYYAGTFSFTPSAFSATAVGFTFLPFCRSTSAGGCAGVRVGVWHKKPPILPIHVGTTTPDAIPLGGEEEMYGHAFLLRVPRI